MSITAARREQIAELEEKITGTIAWIKDKQSELQAMVAIVANVPARSLEQMSRSASSSTQKKGSGETNPIKFTVGTYREMIVEMENAIRDKEQELERLEQEKRGLEEFEKGA